MAEILLPVGRLIGGSLYKPQPRTNEAGQPIIGADGKPETAYNFGVAIPKTGEQHWSQTAWGAQIKAIGDAAYPGQSQSPTFAWKITDGDSQIPNKKNKRPCDQDGYQGGWVLWFNQGWAPKIVNANGSAEITEPDAVLPGYYVQVYCSVAGNKPRPGKAHTPGIYLNPLAVALSAYGPRIESSVDTTNVGFGNAPLPPGASTVPVGAMQQNAAYQPPAPVYQPPAPAPVPNQAFLQVPPAPTPQPGHVMTPVANGVSYEAMIAAGWTDALLIQHGMMLP